MKERLGDSIVGTFLVGVAALLVGPLALAGVYTIPNRSLSLTVAVVWGGWCAIVGRHIFAAIRDAADARGYAAAMKAGNMREVLVRKDSLVARHASQADDGFVPGPM